MLVALEMTSPPHQVFLKLQPENPSLVSLSLLHSVLDFPGLVNLQTKCQRRASGMYEKPVSGLD